MLQELNLSTLETRRNIAKVKLLHSYFHGTKFLPTYVMPMRARCADIRFKPVLGRVNAYTSSFKPATIVLWNGLPSGVVNTVCPSKFTNLVTKVM